LLLKPSWASCKHSSSLTALISSCSPRPLLPPSISPTRDPPLASCLIPTRPDGQSTIRARPSRFLVPTHPRPVPRPFIQFIPIFARILEHVLVTYPRASLRRLVIRVLLAEPRFLVLWVIGVVGIRVCCVVIGIVGVAVVIWIHLVAVTGG